MDGSQNSSLSSDENHNRSIESLTDIGDPSDEISKRKRNRRQPQRFGNAGELDLSDSYDEAFRLYGDNSFDDIDFTPDIGAKVIATATDLSKRNFKKKKIDSLGEHSGTKTDADQSKSQSPILNLNVEFDSLTKELPVKTVMTLQSSTQSVNVLEKNAPTIEILEKEEPEKEKNAPTIGILEKEEPEKEKNAPTIGILENEELKTLLDISKRILSRLDEQSVRISIIEDAILHKNSVLKDRKSNLVEKINESRTFAITNRLPLNNANDLNMFEENLKNSEFERIAIENLSSVPEITAAKGNQAKMLKITVYKIIDRALLANYTWTGKSIGGRAKMPFRNLKKINDLLYGTVSSIDVNYEQSAFNDHLKNKVLKYAYEYGAPQLVDGNQNDNNRNGENDERNRVLKINGGNGNGENDERNRVLKINGGNGNDENDERNRVLTSGDDAAASSICNTRTNDSLRNVHDRLQYDDHHLGRNRVWKDEYGHRGRMFHSPDESILVETIHRPQYQSADDNWDRFSHREPIFTQRPLLSSYFPSRGKYMTELARGRSHH